jgi:hypothetical protein
MKWWSRIKELRTNRWLPFYLPIIGTLLYIAVVLLLIPTELNEKTAESTEVEPAPSSSVARTIRPPTPKRARPSAPPLMTAAPPAH